MGTLHYLPPGHGAARRALQDPKTPAWIKDIAASMTGDTAPEDLIMAEPGTPKTHRTIIAEQRLPVLDYAPADPKPYEEPLHRESDFWDGVAGACVFVALGAVGGIIATILVGLQFLPLILNL